VTSAAIYARVSSARQKKDQTIGSQTQALRAHAAQNRLEVPAEWVFEDEGHSGATLVRPGLEALRDLAAQGCLDVILCYSPDRLARKFAYQALLIEEFARAGTRVEFVNGPRGDSPEDQLLVQFQGMFAEYEKAQLMERYRRGKAYRARSGSVNVLGGAPFGYRYVRKTPDAGARYEIIGHEAVLVAEMFRRYADDGATIADLARWLGSQGIATRTGKSRWDRSVIWGMLRNPAYAGRAVFGKTQIIHEQPGLNRVARLQGRTTPRAVKTVDRPREEWTEITVPAIVSEETFARVQQRLEDNKRFAARNAKVPSLLQGLAACSACGYGYYRTSARTARRKIYYYRCLGSDDYRYEGGRVCGNKPVRADYLDQVVWDHITGLLADPALIRAEISKRLEQVRTSDPVTRQRNQLELALAKAAASITAMVEAFSEQLITIDEMRARMPHLRAREASLRRQLDALDAQAADRDAYLKLADDLEGFLAQLRGNAATATVEERQKVLRLLVKNVLIGPEKITIRHRIPVREPAGSGGGHHDNTDTEGDMRQGYPLCWGRAHAALGSSLPGRREPFPSLENPCLQPPGDHPPRGETADRFQQVLVADLVERRCQVGVKNPHPFGFTVQGIEQGFYRVVTAAARPEPIRSGLKPSLPFGFQRIAHPCLMTPIRNNRNSERAHFSLITGFRYIHPPDRGRLMRADAGVHAHRHLGSRLAGQRDQPVGPRGPAARVALRHLPHADQRIGPAPQHELLHVPGRRPVTLLHRLEDPAAQPPYLLLLVPPVHTLPGVTIE
jgi:DNA invertase Pin-like site-specific DNA recombinase